MCAVCAHVSQLASGTSRPSATCRSTSSRGETVALVGESGSGKSVTALSILRPAASRPGASPPAAIVFNGRRPASALPERQLRAIRGRRDRHGLPGPGDVPRPGVHRRPPDRRGARRSTSELAHERGARRAPSSCSKLVGIPDPERAPEELPAPALGRPAPAGDDRHGAGAATRSCSSPTSRPRRSTSPCRRRSSTCCASCSSERGTAMLLVTHDLGVVAEMADRVVVMYAGQVVEQGSVARRPRATRATRTRRRCSASMPGAVAGTGERLTPIEGAVPNLFAMPAGCRFAPRCPHAFDRCREDHRRCSPVEAALAAAAGCTTASSSPELGPDGRRRSTSPRPTGPTRPHRRAARGPRPRQALPDPRAACCRRPSATSAPSTACRSTSRRGETLGLVGESGCGKTTTGALVLRLLEPDERVGELRGDARCVGSAAELRELRRRVQIVFQDPFSSLDPRMRDRASSARPLEVHGLVDAPASASTRVAELLEQVGLVAGTTCASYPHQFSGGQRQRIGIARALATGPELIVVRRGRCRALDVSIQAQILNLLKDLQARARPRRTCSSPTTSTSCATSPTGSP